MTTLYLPETRTLFLHIPRTGGTWVTRAIEACDIKHESWKKRTCPSYYSQRHPLVATFHNKKRIKVDFIFSFVRHPIKWYESVWRWITRAIVIYGIEKIFRNDYFWRPVIEAKINYNECFTQWIESMVSNQAAWATRLFELYVGPRHGEFCQYIGRTESLTEDFIEVMTLLGYDNKLGKDNRIPKKLSKINGVRLKTVPKQNWTNHMSQMILHEERTHIDRFYSEETKNQRFYGSLRLPSYKIKKCPEIIRHLYKQIKSEKA